MEKRPIAAIMYDFDKTLCGQDMQNYGFIPDLDMTPGEFWQETTEFGEKFQMEKILAYMYMMQFKAKEKNITFNREYLNSLGKKIEYYRGVTSWFKRINDYAHSLGVDVEHYIISSGLKEIIEGTPIASEFKGIYACEYLYDDQGNVIWPKSAINYTQKTQFVFRISKGVGSINDDDEVNQRIPEKDRHVLYRNMIYIGDGITDVPCMRLVKDKGGKSIAIYKRGNKDKGIQLLVDDRVNYVCEANYQENSELDKIVKLQLQNISLVHQLTEKENAQRKKIL